MISGGCLCVFLIFNGISLYQSPHGLSVFAWLPVWKIFNGCLPAYRYSLKFSQSGVQTTNAFQFSNDCLNSRLLKSRRPRILNNLCEGSSWKISHQKQILLLTSRTAWQLEQTNGLFNLLHLTFVFNVWISNEISSTMNTMMKSSGMTNFLGYPLERWFTKSLQKVVCSLLGHYVTRLLTRWTLKFDLLNLIFIDMVL